MNHIHKLQEERDRAQRQRNALAHGLHELLCHISGPKFQGVDAQWISTADVARIVREIQAAETEAADRPT